MTAEPPARPDDVEGPAKPGDYEGPAIELGNEFAEIQIRKVRTRNGARLLISAPRSGQWVALCPVQLEALTWQTDEVFSAMIGHPHAPLPVEGAPGE
ncbi:MAG TPA: hypothetical protein VNP03_11185 [Pseudonocardia sp.]|nr:hypothetical protein [Pseudonocardia sp.]